MIPKTPRKTVLTCDLQAARHISTKDLAREAELMTTCWWDYRGIHPTRRTDLFAALYVKTYQRFYGKYFDYSKEEMVSGISGRLGNIYQIVDPSPEEWLENEGRAKKKAAKAKVMRQTLSGLWRARQAADELGISYSVYLDAIFEKACMSGKVQFKNGRPQLPRPTHLYSDRVKMTALDQQVKELESYTPNFRNVNLMAGSTAPFKADFDKFLYELVTMKKYHTDVAVRRVVELGYIDNETAANWLERYRGE